MRQLSRSKIYSQIHYKPGNCTWTISNASIPTPEPYISRPMFGAFSKAAGSNSLLFVSDSSVDTVNGYGLNKVVTAVKGYRSISKADLKLNNITPKVEVNPNTFEVHINGKKITCKPAEKLPLTQLYNLF